jgi:hypothetical protein
LRRTGFEEHKSTGNTSSKLGNTFLRRRTLVAIVAVLLVLVLLFTIVTEDLLSQKSASKPQVFVGVDVAYGNETAVYTVADAVAGYANLIVIGSLNVTQDTAALTRVCNFLYQKGFYFIIYVGFAQIGYLPPRGPDPAFFSTADSQWGDKFLGIYLFDEVGGKQLDTSAVVPGVPNSTFEERDFSFVSESYVATLTGDIAISLDWFNPSHVHPQLFTSDYGLYWYDYLSGYGTVFSEFVGNQSRQIAVALDRGAAYTLGRDWGAIITYSDGGTLENASQLYNDMTFAWQSGAKYIIIFDGNATSTSSYGVLTHAHLDAMQEFWNNSKTSKPSEVYPANIAYVLPADYGYGFRSSIDTIWGLWNADALTANIWDTANSLLATYGNNLDIVYATRIDNELVALPYKTLIFWNGTTVQTSAEP